MDRVLRVIQSARKIISPVLRSMDSFRFPNWMRSPIVVDSHDDNANCILANISTCCIRDVDRAKDAYFRFVGQHLAEDVLHRTTVTVFVEPQIGDKLEEFITRNVYVSTTTHLVPPLSNGLTSQGSKLRSRSKMISHRSLYFAAQIQGFHPEKLAGNLPISGIPGFSMRVFSAVRCIRGPSSDLRCQGLPRYQETVQG